MGAKTQIIAGIDEAGRGPLAGPVVAAAVIIPNNAKVFAEINDSKKLTESKREELFEKIVNTYHYGIGIVDHKKIDKINILQATFQAMKKAVKQLQTKRKLKHAPGLCLVDGNKTIPGLKIEQEAIVKGDSKIKEISAASIIAKVTRDRIMLELDKKHPKYGFAKHK